MTHGFFKRVFTQIYGVFPQLKPYKVPGLWLCRFLIIHSFAISGEYVWSTKNVKQRSCHLAALLFVHQGYFTASHYFKKLILDKIAC